MARSREALVLLIDVGLSMHGVLPEVEKVCSMLVQKKLIFGKSDEVGIVLFGTDDTNNDLEKEVGGYEHVVVLRNVKVVDGDAVDILQNLPRGTRSGDFLDAVIVGMDMLIKKYGRTNKGKQRLCLITDARHPIKAPSEGIKEDQVDIVCQQMQDHGMRLDSIVIRENSAEAAHQKIKGKQRFCLITDARHPIKAPSEGTKEDPVDIVCQQMQDHGMRLDSIVIRENSAEAAHQMIKDENDRLLQQFSQKTKARATYVGNSTALLGALRTRNILPVTVFRGDLELSSTMKIKVWVYKKTSEEKFPTLKKFSDKAPPTDKYATHEVKVDFEYKSMEDPDKVVPPEQRIKGYRYGPQVVPISSAEWDAVKFKPEKSVKLLGFADASNIMRHYYMKDVYVFIPEPGNSKAIVASSAIARAMKAMNKVAILRCVWRQGQGNVVVGVLTPNISCIDSIPDSFYFNVLPFAEDIREFQFPSFSSFPSSWQPNEQQQEATDNLVKMLDLASPGTEEILQPDFTPNPVLERFYRFLDLKSRQPDAEVPPLDRSLKRITESDPELLSKCKPAIDNFHSQYELKENPKKKKSSRQAWREKSSASDEEAGAENKVSGNESAKLIKDSSMVKVEKIGDLNPVQDFEAMMARRDSSKWVRKAIKEMQDYVYDLLENSYEGNTYPKAIECLFALRKGCILEQEPREFNRNLHYLYEKWKTTDLADFFKLLSSKSLTLISKSEAEDSDVTDEEAKNFPVKTELATQ